MAKCGQRQAAMQCLRKAVVAATSWGCLILGEERPNKVGNSLTLSAKLWPKNIYSQSVNRVQSPHVDLCYKEFLSTWKTNTPSGHRKMWLLRWAALRCCLVCFHPNFNVLKYFCIFCSILFLIKEIFLLHITYGCIFALKEYFTTPQMKMCISITHRRLHWIPEENCFSRMTLLCTQNPKTLDELE